ncbi:MAG: redoxin domain-containing protein [Dehalococcoidia bacterium]
MPLIFRNLVLVVFAMMFVVVISACSSGGETTEPGPANEGLSATVEKSDPATAPPTASPQENSPSIPPTTSPQENVPSAPSAPVFAVETIDGETIRLEDLVGTVPVYVLFIPSTADEIDRSQLSGIQARHEAFVELGAQVVVVISDLPTRVIELRDELGLQFALIADPLHVVASDWQVFDLDDEGKVSPASFVFDAHGSLIARLVAQEPDERPTVDEVLYVIEESLSVGAA